MTPDEKLRLRKQYESFADSQILQMLSDGPAAYVDGAYALLQEEVKRRGLAVEEPRPQEEMVSQEKSLAGPEADVNSYVQLAIVNNESDRVFLESLISSTDIAYFFQNLSLRRDVDLPLGLMVDNLRLEEAIELFKDFQPSGSILLW